MTQSERGSAALELALLTPVLLLILMLVVAGGRLVNVRSDVSAAARDAARAASMSHSASGASEDAQHAIDDALAARQSVCTTPRSVVDTNQFGPGQFVSVTVLCDVSMGDLSLLPFATTRTVSASFSEVVDRYGSVTP